jgi:hypothetical protein
VPLVRGPTTASEAARVDTLHNAGPIDTTGSVFAARLSSLLRTSRNGSGAKLRGLARASGGAFSVAELRRLEAGEHDLAGLDLPLLAGLYGIDLAALSSARVPIVVDADAGRIQTAGITRTFEPGQADSLLLAYLLLVRELRSLQHEPTVTLRRDDIDALAASLETDGETVLARLGDLMGMTVAQRRSMVTAFVAGATLIALASGAIAIDVGNVPVDPSASGGITSAEVVVDPDDGADPLSGVLPGPSDVPAEDGAGLTAVGDEVATVQATLPTATSAAGPAPAPPAEPAGDPGTIDRGHDAPNEPDPTGGSGEGEAPPWQDDPEGPQGGSEPVGATDPGSDDLDEPNLGGDDQDENDPADDADDAGDPADGDGDAGGSASDPGDGEDGEGAGEDGAGSPGESAGDPGDGDPGDPGDEFDQSDPGDQGGGQGTPNHGVGQGKGKGNARDG